MKFNIQYLELVKINDLRTALIFLLPNCIDKINNFLSNIRKFDILSINDDYISINYNDILIYDYELVDAIKLLNKTNIFLYIENDEQYKNMCNIDNKYETDLAVTCNFYYVINSGKHISAELYEIFFKKYKTFDFKNFNRMIKLNQLVK